MNFFFLSDDKFAQIFAVALESLYTQQVNTKDLRVFLIENKLSDDSKNKLNSLAGKHGRKIEYIPMPDIKAWIGKALYIPRMLNMVDFARLFAADLLPEDIDKVIQLDCDLVIRHPIDELWNLELGNDYCRMINEGHSAKMREVLNIPKEGMYYNSGVVLINLKKWRDDNIGQKCIDYLKMMHGYVPVNAQGVMNAVMDGGIGLLPLKYNVYSLMYSFTHKEFMQLRCPTCYYGESEYNEALADPYIVHFMTCFYLDARPWMRGCLHPLTKDYLYYKSLTPWANEPLWEPVSKKIRQLYCAFCHAIPKSWAIKFSSFIYVVLIPARHKYMEKKFAKADIKKA
ncbi:MAG: glycosyltransferase family 8 protein [Prevotella sp.]|nr:glycosyltransferase family 8 protein [Prevotella sp.]